MASFCKNPHISRPSTCLILFYIFGSFRAAYQLAASDFPHRLSLFECVVSKKTNRERNSKKSNRAPMTSASPLALAWLRLATGGTQLNKESDSDENVWLENWH